MSCNEVTHWSFGDPLELGDEVSVTAALLESYKSQQLPAICRIQFYTFRSLENLFVKTIENPRKNITIICILNLKTVLRDLLEPP